jgi:hypothetical protein
MAEKHTILGGKVHVYKRPESPIWQCSAYLGSKNRRASTKESSLSKARDFAEDWYLELRGTLRGGEIRIEKSFLDAAKQFEREYEIITEGHRSPKWIEGHKARLRLHLSPYFGKTGLSEVTAGAVQEYRIHRIQSDKNGKAPSRSTLHDEVVTLRQVLKTAIRHNWLAHLPDLSAPYNRDSKAVGCHRELTR